MAAFNREEWDWWKAARAAVEADNAKAIGSDEIPIGEDPMQGHYRFRTWKDGPFIPVQFWYAGGVLKCMRNGAMVDENVARGVWGYCAKNPISQEQLDAFNASKETTPNGVWFDEVVVLKEDGSAQSSHRAEKPKATPKKRGPATRRDPATDAGEKITPPAQPAAEPEPTMNTFTLDDGTVVELPDDATVRDGVIYDWADDEIDPSKLPVVSKPETEIVEPVMRYWTRQSTKETFASTDDHSGDPDYREQSETNFKAINLLKPKPGPATRYWYHPESESSYSTVDGLEQQPSEDGMLEEITREKFNELQDLKAAQAGMDLGSPAAVTPKVAPMKAPMVSEEVEEEEEVEEPPIAGIGDNSGVSAFDKWKSDIEDWTRAGKKLAGKPTPKTKEEANAFADTISKLADFLRDGDDMRVDEKRPHLDANKAIDSRYKPIVAAADDAKREVARVYKPYLDKAAQEEADRVAAENKRRRDEVAAENAAAAARAEANGEAPAAEKAVREVRAKSVGAGTRRAVSAVSKKTGKIDDLEKACIYFATQKGGAHKDLVDIIRRLGTITLKAGVDVPGMRLVEETDVR